MQLFKNLTETLFKETEDGKTIYYGKGLLRKAYIITDDETKEKLYRFHKRVNTYLLPLGIVYAVLLGLAGAPLAGMIPVFLVAIIVHYRHKNLLKGLPVYDKQMDKAEVKDTIARVFPKPFLIFMIINGLLAIITAIALPSLLDKTLNEVATLMGILFVMGAMLLGFGWYLYRLNNRG
jgi:hypothetical protein